MKELLKRNIETASGVKKPELVLKNGLIVNVFTGEIIQGDIAIDVGTIVGIGNYEGEMNMDLNGSYVAPGLIDSHIHIESSMVTPGEFARIVIPRGTTTIIADPHEIVNVCGLDGLDYMMRASEGLPLNIYFMLPSCVPATPFEDSGAILKADSLKKYIEHERVLGLGEVMDYPSVIRGDENILEKLLIAQNKIIDGHGPMLSDEELNAYVTAGVKTDHECSTIEEMIHKLRAGLYVEIREGSAARNLEHLAKGLSKNYIRRCTFCTDDRHPRDILKFGHIDNNIKLAVENGIDPVEAIQMASLNTVECYGLKKMGAIAPGYAADLIVFDDLKKFNILKVFIRGKLAAENNRMLLDIHQADYSKVVDTVKIKPLNREDLKIKLESDFVNVIQLIPHDLTTRKVIRKISRDPDGIFEFQQEQDILKIAVIERHRATGKVGLGFIENFKLQKGAIASTISHDSHNIVVLGDNDEDMLLAANEVVKIGGGIVMCSNGKVLELLELPIAGLISDNTMEYVARRLEEMMAIAYNQLHVNMDLDPFLSLAFLTLPVIPEIKITNRGLFDVNRMEFIGLTVQ